VTNTGVAPEVIKSSVSPAAPFTATGVPAAGYSVAPGGSFVVTVTYAPTVAETSTSSLSVTSTSGTLTIPISGVSITGQGTLVFSPPTLDFGSVPLGSSRTLTFEITNTGNVPVTVTKAAPPTGDFSSATPLPEGSIIGAGLTVTQSVTFTPTSATEETAGYEITGDTGQGAMTENFLGTGGPVNSIPSPASGSWTYNGTAVASGSAVQLNSESQQGAAGSVFYDNPVPSAGLKATFTAQLGPGTDGDGLTFALLDATKATPTALGVSGGGLGVSGLPGVAVSLQTSWNGQSNSTNFTGIIVGPGSGSDNVTYTATAEVPTPLRTGTHTVTVAASGGDLVVTVDGTQLLNTPVTLPPQVLVGFTAGTGELADTHIISGVQITTGGSVAPPSQPLSAGPTQLNFGGETVGSSTNQTVTLTNTGSATETVTAAATPSAPFAASVPATGTTVAPGSSITVPVSFAPTATGSFTSSLSVTTNGGTVTVPLSGVGGSIDTLPDFSSGTWTANGTAVVSGNTATLTTDGQNSAAGDVINPQTMSPYGINATFTESISGAASTGADGLTFALLDSSATTVNSLGSDGSSLGVGGLPAVFVSFQTYSGNGVYAGNYVSVGTSAAGSSGLALLGTNKSIPTLRGTPHTIGIQVTADGYVVVSIDGVQVLDVAVPSLPPSVRVAYTAGTGGLTDTHAISDPTVTYTS
jgi:hypothetical protein